jgi:hypothetical protein
LPDNPDIRIFAITAVQDDRHDVIAAQPLYDDFNGRTDIAIRKQDTAIKTADLKPLGKITIDRQESYDKLSMGAPLSSDYADQNAGNGVVIDYSNEHANPHDLVKAQGTRLNRLNNGKTTVSNDDRANNTWFDGSEARFIMDIKKSVTLKVINTYSRHRTNRSPQNFTLWASNQAEPGQSFEDEVQNQHTDKEYFH